MQTKTQKLLNSVNTSTERWRRQGFQRRFSVTDLHGVEYKSSMSNGVPAQFYTAISYDFDRLAHWWLKVIISPMGVKSPITQGDGVDPDDSISFTGSGVYEGSAITYGGKNLSIEHLKSIVNYAKEYSILPSGLVTLLYFESEWGDTPVAEENNNWSNMLYKDDTRPSGVIITKSKEYGTDRYYNKYSTVNDSIKDLAYMLSQEVVGNNQRLYNTFNKRTLDSFITGLYQAGGAFKDYNALGYTSLSTRLKTIYSGINEANNNVLAEIDKQVIGSKPTGSNTGGNNTVVASADNVHNALSQLNSKMNTTIGSGECYAIPAYYSLLLGGAHLGGGVTQGKTHQLGAGINASDIGTDYDWGSIGWGVERPTDASYIIAGAILNFKAVPNNPYGHTGVIKSVSGDTAVVLEQNYAGYRKLREVTRSISSILAEASTLVYPPELVQGLRVSGQVYNKNINQKVVTTFPKDIKISIDGIDLTPMFKAQFDGKWIDSYSVYPNEKPNEGYDVMLSAIALTDEQRNKLFTSGEHLVEISGSMDADVILRTYLKYNHLN